MLLTNPGFNGVMLRSHTKMPRGRLPQRGADPLWTNPSHKASLLRLAVPCAFVEKSILVVTEGLGQCRFHGRVVLLVNEHTASVGEMVAAFAEENNLALIIGSNTPGRLLSSRAFKVDHGYILGLPVAAYLTWHGRMLENNGIVPRISAELSRDALREGRDTQLETAVEAVQKL